MDTYTYGGTFSITIKTDWAAKDALGNDVYVNYTDFNRVETNISTAKNYLASIYYASAAITTVTNRTQMSIDFLSGINRIEQNLDGLRAAFLTPAGYLPMETWIVGKGFDYSDMNRLEANIKLLMDYGDLVFRSFKYCGATNCGDQGGLY